VQTVYVFDSGIQADLATFSGRVTTSSFCSQSSNCAETGLEVVDEVPMGAGHGTQVASIIGGVGFGINSNVRIVDVRVLDKLGVGRVDDIIAALDYVVGKGMYHRLGLVCC
jgi:subtilisin family serine protease